MVCPDTGGGLCFKVSPRSSAATRTPAEVPDLIEAKGLEVAAAVAALRALRAG